MARLLLIALFLLPAVSAQAMDGKLKTLPGSQYIIVWKDKASLNEALGIINAGITSKSTGNVKLADIREERAKGVYSAATRSLLGKSARLDGKKARKRGWFKTLGYMEDVTFDIVLPAHLKWDAEFKARTVALWKWISSGS